MTKTVRSRFDHEIGQQVEGCTILEKRVVIPPEPSERRLGVYEYVVDAPPRTGKATRPPEAVDNARTGTGFGPGTGLLHARNPRRTEPGGDPSRPVPLALFAFAPRETCPARSGGQAGRHQFVVNDQVAVLAVPSAFRATTRQRYVVRLLSGEGGV